MPQADHIQEPVQERRDRVIDRLREGDDAADRQHKAAVQKIVDEMLTVRKEIGTSVTKLSLLCDRLQTQVRRRQDDTTSSYTMYATGHQRLASALSNGIRRTASMDRMLDRAAQEREEDRRRAERELAMAKARQQKRALDKSLLPSDDDFAEVYGELEEEEVSDGG